MTNIAVATQDVRKRVSEEFIRGEGIEVGALDAPFPKTSAASTRYIDRMAKADLLKQYPELQSRAGYIVEPDILDDGETLKTVPSASADFIVASHFLEHCQNPIGTLRAHFRVLRRNGTLILAVPNTANPQSWDHGRQLTSFSHLLTDDRAGPAGSRRSHFEEWCIFAGKMTDRRQIESEVDRLMSVDYSIHFHCWTKQTFKDFLERAITYNNLDAKIALFDSNDYEIIAVLRKGFG
jgi:SAM-dependent methyltransferase